MQVICFHHNDADGIMSAASVYNYYKQLDINIDCQMFPCAYRIKI